MTKKKPSAKKQPVKQRVEKSSAAATEPTSAPKPSKQPPASVPSRGRGIGRLAERLIVEHSDWAYRRIAEEVNRQVEGAKASEKSVRWYASRMRRRENHRTP